MMHGGSGQQRRYGSLAVWCLPVGKNQQAGTGLHLVDRILAQG